MKTTSFEFRKGVLKSNSRLQAPLVFDNSRNQKHPLWNVSEVASFLRISERTVRDLVYKRQIPYRKVGKCVRFNREEIERWTLPHEGVTYGNRSQR